MELSLISTSQNKIVKRFYYLNNEQSLCQAGNVVFQSKIIVLNHWVEENGVGENCCVDSTKKRDISRSRKMSRFLVQIKYKESGRKGPGFTGLNKG
jgi:hypothetical protein